MCHRCSDGMVLVVNWRWKEERDEEEKEDKTTHLNSDFIFHLKLYSLTLSHMGTS